MEEIEYEGAAPENSEELGQDVEVTEGEPKAEAPKRTPEEELKYFEGRAERLRTKLGIKPKAEAPTEAPKPTTGDLDETQLDYLDLKGINESDDLDIIQTVMKRTGQTVRQALKDEYVVEKLKANQARREVANAMPSGTKRSGAGAMGVDAALARYEATGELPADFETRSAVINLKEAKTSGTAPPWRR